MPGARCAGALQAGLAARVAAAAWRARRADRLEAALLMCRLEPSADPAGERQAALGLGLIRDGNGPRALETRWPEPAPISGGRCAPANRYRGSVLTELARRSAPTLVVAAGRQVRGLGALRLQAEAAGPAAADLPQPARVALTRHLPQPNEPEKAR